MLNSCVFSPFSHCSLHVLARRCLKLPDLSNMDESLFDIPEPSCNAHFVTPRKIRRIPLILLDIRRSGFGIPSAVPGFARFFQRVGPCVWPSRRIARARAAPAVDRVALGAWAQLHTFSFDPPVCR